MPVMGVALFVWALRCDAGLHIRGLVHGTISFLQGFCWVRDHVASDRRRSN